ncbi:TPA: DUF2326 domain-containing protein [Listeria innocua]|uniref:DUF2326 domain-containing protein n=1 Tax=Listeria innocua TaxID=1642 RepID=UPI0010E735B2|nr:DUF2326 domain-containing protein [Listeria innocua]MBF2410337.1 DUF2326 domain-containing protein [Listeria innocua]MDH4597817.1 DUF2326 domain-containing protein [Listeria innocua]MDH4684321.1 DUF2326 domain-containing protein [Listeria innocua]MDH4903037.1 DUF2326 domain-containing protein [Listeria innocua]HBM3567357.1 DUF2326 domain-containing protein [Listeria innocua]
MKILNLKIVDLNNGIIQEISFNETGSNFIFGDVTKPNSKTETSNSIGKTLLLGFINYIYGADEDSEISKEAIENWKLIASIKYKDNILQVQRIIGSSNFIINEETISLNEYRKKFQISRALYSKQIFLNDRSSLIPAYSKNPSKDDIEQFLSMICLDKFVNPVDEYYAAQNNIKKNKETKKQLLELNNWKERDIEARQFYLEKKIEEIKRELATIDSEHSEAEIYNQKDYAVKEYSEKNEEVKQLLNSKQKLELENKRLSIYMKEAKALNDTAENIKKLYKKAKYELPERVIKTLEETEIFYKDSILDRKKLSAERIKENELFIKKYQKRILQLKRYLSNIDKVIQETDAFKEALIIYKSLNEELQDLMYEKGNLDNMMKLNENINESDTKLNMLHSDLIQLRKDYDEIIIKYREYLFELVNDLYSEKVQAFFDVKVRSKHQQTRPVQVDLKIDGDSGEGVGTVRKRLIDILIFRWGKKLDFLFHDSSCFTGVDSRQISKLLEILDNVSEETNKQYIVTLNRFQIDKNDTELLDIVDKRTIISLSEDKKLLGFDF